MAVSYLKSNISLDIPYTTYSDILKRRAGETPNKPALIFIDKNNDKTVITFGDISDKAARFAKALVQMGVKKGDIIGLCGPNVPEWVIADFGIQMAGGCTLCLPNQMKEEAMAELFQSVGKVKFIIIDLDQREHNCHVVKYFLEKSLQSFNVTNADTSALQVILFNRHESFLSLNTVTDMCSIEVDAVLPTTDPEDNAVLLLTSGTTSVPKAIPHSSHALVVVSLQFAHAYKSDDSEMIMYNDRPFFWGAGYTFWEIASGGTRITFKNILQHSSITDAAEFACTIIKRENATHALLVPSVLDAVIKQNMAFHIRRILTGGMIVYSSMLECIGKVCDELLVVYGTTEFGLLASRVYTEEDKSHLKRNTLSYRPEPGVEIKVTNDDNVLQPVGQRGKIWVRSIKRFPGYLNYKISPGSEEYFNKSGWFCLDDGGFITDDHALIVEGRRHEMLQVFGRYIYPCEIENVIKSKDNVVAAIVMPVEVMDIGDLVPVAAIIYRPQCEESMECMQNYIRREFKISEGNQLLEDLYVPRVIIPVKEFPLLANGKPNRNAVRKMILEKTDTKMYNCK